MTKSVTAKTWNWNSGDVWLDGRYNSQFLDGIQPLSGFVGVPDPGWGINETAPAAPGDWSSEVAGFYYVDRDTGTDSGRTYGTPTTPRATIPTPIPAGSRVELHGTYDHIVGGVITIKGEGTESNPVWVVGIDGNRPTVTGAKLIMYGTWTFIEKLNVTQTVNNYLITQIGSATTGFQASHVMFRDSDVAGWIGGGPGLGIESASSSEISSNIIASGNTIHDLNDTTNPVDVDTTCINIANWGEDIWVLENTLDTSAGTGIQVGTDPTTEKNVRRCYVAKNNVTDTRQSGIWVKNGRDVIVSQNTIDNVIDFTPTSPSKGMGGQYFVDGVWYIFNEVSNCRYAFRVPSLTAGSLGEYYVIGNIFRNMGQTFTTITFTSFEGVISIKDGTDVHIVDNTMYDCVSGIHLWKSTDNTTLDITGNIVKDISVVDGFHFWSDTTTQNGAVLTKNQWHDLTQIRMKNGATGTEYNTLASWQSATSNSVGDQYGDPLFTNAGINDFTLQAGSPCIDASAESPVYDLFESQYSLDIKVDFDGNSRPTTSGDWDIGALERVA